MRDDNAGATSQSLYGMAGRSVPPNATKPPVEYSPVGDCVRRPRNVSHAEYRERRDRLHHCCQCGNYFVADNVSQLLRELGPRRKELPSFLACHFAVI
jgi:hypothetical protein